MYRLSKKTTEKEQITMKNENKIIQNPADYDYTKASSAQDCTGLIPAGITCEEEIESYEELYPFLPQIAKNGQKEGSL